MTLFTKIMIGFLIGAIILIGFLFYRVNVLSKAKAVAEQNVKAATGSLIISKTKADSTEYEKSLYITRIGALTQLNQELAEEVKEEKGDIKLLSDANVTIGTKDTIRLPGTIKYLPNTNSKDTAVQLSFTYDKTFTGGSRSLAGFTNYDPFAKTTSTTLTKDLLTLDLITGIRHDNTNGYTIFVRSDYPGFVVNNLSGAILDPTMFQTPVVKHWHIGPSVGAQYYFQTNKVQPYIGIGITRSLISW